MSYRENVVAFSRRIAKKASPRSYFQMPNSLWPGSQMFSPQHAFRRIISHYGLLASVGTTTLGFGT
eukprot:358514-Chlamydomonas_euryale.AAC.14